MWPISFWASELGQIHAELKMQWKFRQQIPPQIWRISSCSHFCLSLHFQMRQAPYQHGLGHPSNADLPYHLEIWWYASWFQFYLPHFHLWWLWIDTASSHFVALLWLRIVFLQLKDIVVFCSKLSFILDKILPIK